MVASKNSLNRAFASCTCHEPMPKLPCSRNNSRRRSSLRWSKIELLILAPIGSEEEVHDVAGRGIPSCLVNLHEEVAARTELPKRRDIAQSGLADERCGCVVSKTLQTERIGA